MEMLAPLTGYPPAESVTTPDSRAVCARAAPTQRTSGNASATIVLERRATLRPWIIGTDLLRAGGPVGAAPNRVDAVVDHIHTIPVSARQGRPRRAAPKAR